MKNLFFAIFLITLITAQKELNDLVCSGFVEFPSDLKTEDLDLSQIEVHLLSEDDRLIEKSNCASNGFYLIPIYDLKNYKLKVNLSVLIPRWTQLITLISNQIYLLSHSPEKPRNKQKLFAWKALISNFPGLASRIKSPLFLKTRACN